MLFYGLKNVAVLMSGLLLLTQGVSSAAIPELVARQVTMSCPATYSTTGPLIADCQAALALVTPGQPQICTLQFATEWNYAKSGTCTIHTYDPAGKAHCLNGDKIIAGVNALLKSCVSGKSTGGKYFWTSVQGLTLIKTV